MARLRIIPAVKWVVAVFIGEFRTAVYLGWPWLAVVGAVLLAVIFFYPDLTAVLIQTRPLTVEQQVQLLPGVAVLYAVTLVAYSSTAVNWHHYLLLKDLPRGWMRLRLDWPVLRYVGNTLLIGLAAGVFVGLAALVMVIIFFVTFWLSGNASLALSFIMTAALIIAVVVLVYRLSLKLPAIAIDVDDYGFSNAMRDSEGSTLRIIGFAILLGIASLVFFFAGNLPRLFGYAFGLDDGFIMTASIILVQALTTWAGMIFNVTAITLLYAIFAEGAEV